MPTGGCDSLNVGAQRLVRFVRKGGVLIKHLVEFLGLSSPCQYGSEAAWCRLENSVLRLQATMCELHALAEAEWVGTGRVRVEVSGQRCSYCGVPFETIAAGLDILNRLAAAPGGEGEGGRGDGGSRADDSGGHERIHGPQDLGGPCVPSDQEAA